MKEYTTDIHAARVLKMLGRKNPCKGCPAAKYYGQLDVTNCMWRYYARASIYAKPAICLVCGSFVGISQGKNVCPCHYFGEEEAIRRTWIQLEAKGYLE